MRRKLLIALVALPLLLLLAAVIYLTTADFGGYRDNIERAVGEAIGRKVSIDGEFHVRVSRSITVVANEVSLSNPGWSTEPTMARADRLELVLDLWSLLFGPVRVRRLAVSGLRGTLERNPRGGGNWIFETGAQPDDPAAESGGDGGIIFEDTRLRDVELDYRDPTRDAPLHLRLESFDALGREENRLLVQLAGEFDGIPVELNGHLGPLDRLFAGKQLVLDFGGRIGRAEFTAAGSVEDVVHLADPDFRIEAHGADIAVVSHELGIPELGTGPFRLTASATSSMAGVALEIDADLGELTVDLRGEVASLIEPVPLDLTVDASGPDLSVALARLGIDDVPEGPFNMSGGAEWTESRIILESLDVRVGENALEADGVVGLPPHWSDTDLILKASGPDLSVFDALSGLQLPTLSYQVETRALHTDRGIEVKQFSARVGEAGLELEGIVGDPTSFEGADLVLEASGPDLSEFDSLAGVALPVEPFGVRGRVTRRDGGVLLDAATFRLGGNTLHAEGLVADSPDFAGTDLRLRFSGPDLESIGLLAALEGLPAAAFDIEGGLRLSRSGYRLDEISGSVGEVDLSVDGIVAAGRDLKGTELTIRLQGPDLSALGTVAGLAGLPDEPYEIEGGIGVSSGGYELKDVAAIVGSFEIAVDGRIDSTDGAVGTDLEIEARGPDLSVLGNYVGVAGLPPVAFSVAGRGCVEEGGYRLDDLSGELDGNRFGLNGILGPAPALDGTEFEIELSGPDLSSVARRVTESGLSDVPPLPAKRFSASGRVRIDSSGYFLDGIVAAVGSDALRLEGIVGRPPGFLGSRITFDADGPDCSWIGSIAGIPLPAEPFAARGGVERFDSGFRFHGLILDLGEHRAEIDGALGDPPRLAGTNLDVVARGPNLDLIRQLADLPTLPTGPFEIKGHFDGTTDEFAVRDFVASVGNSDLSGSMRVDLRNKPSVTGGFSSQTIDVTALLGGEIEALEAKREEDRPPAGENAKEDWARDTGGGKPAKQEARMISDAPLDLEVLRSLDADIGLTVDNVIFRKGRLSDVIIDLRLLDGELALDRLSINTEGSGKIRGSLTLGPVVDGYRIVADLHGQDWRLDFTGAGIGAEKRPLTEFDVEFEGQGRSLHHIAGSANGRLLLVTDEGVLDSRALDMLGTGVFAQMMDTLNPFSKSEPRTRLECAVLVFDIEDGVTSMTPLALRTDKTTIIGHGRVDLKTESVDLEWTAKPRKGIGLSPSAITNPYIKLGGTLSNPAIEIKPIDSVTSTGVAVATGGLSLLGRGLWDRVTAERKVCARALKDLEKKEKQQKKKQKRNN